MNPSPPPQADADALLSVAKRALRIEAAAIVALEARIGAAFIDAAGLILGCRGRVIVSGVGKSGHIGRKIAATLASTGTPAYFVHAAEANHGDLGMITSDDLLIAISNSGESDELVSILPIVKRQGGRIIALTGNPQSTLARESDVHLDAGVAEEACPLNLAPTASTTAALALGDALAVALLDARGFSETDFARSHPGGSLGRRLLTHVGDVMREAGAVPSVGPEIPLSEAVVAMSRGGLGLVAVTEGRRIAGIFTDGDLRRAFARGVDVRSTRMHEVMTANPQRVRPEQLAVEAVEVMERLRINALLVVDDKDELVGALNMHDLFRAKVI